MTDLKHLASRIERLQAEKAQHLPSSREAVTLSKKIKAYEAIMTLPVFTVLAGQKAA